MSDLQNLFGPPLVVCDVAKALADRVLVDAAPMSRELFPTVTVMCTAAAWNDCVAWQDHDGEATTAVTQDQRGRLWDVLWMAFCAVRGHRLEVGTSHHYELHRVAREARADTEGEVIADLVTLKLTPTLHDDGSALLVISLPTED